MSRTPPTPVVCPRCGNTVGAEQAWCLSCGAPARTRMRPTPNWRLPVAVVAATILVVAGGTLGAFVALTTTGDEPTPATTTVAPGAAGAPAPDGPAAPAPTGGTATPGTAAPPAGTPAPDPSGSTPAPSGGTPAPEAGTPAPSAGTPAPSGQVPAPASGGATPEGEGAP